jgi:hypothetical protein
MADSVTPTDIPVLDPATGRPWDLVAGYIDGVPRWPADAWDRFPDSVHVRIALDPATNDGDVLDIERGAANPDQAPGWTQRRRAAGADPTNYCNASTWPAVRAAYAAAGVPEPHWWIAQYDGVAELLPGTVAKQYADPPGSGGHWDLTAAADTWPGIDKEDSVTITWDDQISPDGLVDATGKQITDKPKNFLGYGDTFAKQAKDIGVSNGAKLDAVLAQLGAAVTAEQQRDAELLAAVKGLAITPVDPTALANALTASGLPAAVVQELLDVLAKASNTTSIPATPPNSAAPATPAAPQS